ncbi:MAG TPA: ANTAR domain-containing protein [Gemmatimonadaceae bacterium]|nr:ANTAR domain-containing protein [Gemmatimonadaceae bacterium]
MPLSSLRVLIGEDESVTALAMEQDLRALGHTVIGVAADGLTAVSMAHTLAPDLVILDCMMPHLGGMDAAERIHADRPVPIVIVTAYSDLDTIGRATTAPVFHYLVKPVSAAQLGAAIAVAQARHAEWMEARQATDALQRKLEDRKLIERAKGILMERDGLTESAAYRLLQRTSQSRNTSMAELARSLLAAEELTRAPTRPSGPTRVNQERTSP